MDLNIGALREKKDSVEKKKRKGKESKETKTRQGHSCHTDPGEMINPFSISALLCSAAPSTRLGIVDSVTMLTGMT